MNPAEVLKLLCKEQRIPIYKVEKDLGYGNGYLGAKGKTDYSSRRAAELAGYFDVPVSVFLTGLDVLPGETVTDAIDRVFPEEKKKKIQWKELQEKMESSESSLSLAYEIILKEYGESAADAVFLFLQLDVEDRAELKGEARQMLRLRKYAEKLENEGEEVE